jgi:H+/Cl- antiporter ClcA
MKHIDTRKITYIGKGVVIGTLAGLIVSVFRLLIQELTGGFDWLLRSAQKDHWFLLAAIIAMLVVWFVNNKLVASDPNISGSGIPQVEGLLQGHLALNWWSVLWKKFVGGVLAISSGLFLGREGPSIQLGAMVGTGLAVRGASSEAESKIFTSAGSAAGLAAAFNAPVAGLLFVLEEVHHSFSPLVMLTSFAAAVTSNFISLTFFGLRPVLSMGSIPQVPLYAYALIVPFAIIIGLTAYAYQYVTLNLPRITSLIPLMLIIPITLLWPDLVGGGHQVITLLGNTRPTVWVLLGILILRFVFSGVSYASGLPGGIFLPILSLGATLGVLFARVLNLPEALVIDFLILGMAGYFGAIAQAPLTAIVLVSEMVGSIVHLMPLAVTVLIAYIINEMIGGAPIYERMLENLLLRRGLEQEPADLTTVEFPVNAKLDQQMVRDVDFPIEMHIISIRRGAKDVPYVKGDTIMRLGDVLIISLPQKDRARIIKSLETI